METKFNTEGGGDLIRTLVWPCTHKVHHYALAFSLFFNIFPLETSFNWKFGHRFFFRENLCFTFKTLKII